MKVKAFLAGLGLIFILSLFTSCDMVEKVDGHVKWAGLRYSPYGVGRKNVPTNAEWQKYIETLTGSFEESSGAFILIPGTASFDDDGTCYCSFNFKRPSGVNDSGKKFYFREEENETFNYEDFLTMCDSKGYSVWLQAEPGHNDLSEIAKVLLKKYGSHKCVKGYGIDLEWWYPIDDEDTNTGKRLDDATAKQVVETVRSFNPDYTVFAKHWMSSYMPSKYRDGMIFVNDSQGFTSSSDMISQFTTWAKHFQGSPVFFQIGYARDQKIWEKDPLKTAQAICDSAKEWNEEIGVIWVDFTFRTALDRYVK